MTTGRMDELGLDTGLVDRNKSPIHLGDTLEFDSKEWGNRDTNKFVITFEEGELSVLGCVSELSEWCTVIKKWNET